MGVSIVIYSTKQLTFLEPTKQEVSLTPQLASVIHSLHKQKRESMFHLCMIAYGLRKHNLKVLRSGRGGNARGQGYSTAFNAYYENNKLGEVYGSRENFTMYAMAGRLLTYVRWQLDAKNGTNYINNLPASLTALYECSQILFTRGESATNDSRKRFQQALTKPLRDGTRHNALIHPLVTRVAIQQYRKKKSSQGMRASSPEYSILLGTIRAHRDLYKFTKRGAKQVGTIDLKDVKGFLRELKTLIAKHSHGHKNFALESNLSEVERSYMDAKSPDYGADIKKK